MKQIVVSAIAILAFACANPTGPRGGTLEVRRAPPQLELSNQTASAVYFFAIVRPALAYTEWVPCTNPASCTAVKAGASLSVQYTQIQSYTTGASEAVVFWWHLVPGPADGLQPDSVRAVIVSL